MATPMKLEELAARFTGVTFNGNGFDACCPIHGDDNPSMSISEVDGKFLLHCHVGCPTKDILAAVDLSLSDLYTSNGAPQYFNYTDENDEILYRIKRTPSK